MITLEKLYAATEDGLRIITYYYPQAAQVAGTTNKFKVRESEKTPSATIKKYTSNNGLTCWKVTDFGDEGRALSPIDIVMKEEGVKMGEAILKMAMLFNVPDELDRTVNKPEWSERPATAEEQEGDILFELDDHISEAHLKILGPKVTMEHTNALSWYAAKWVGTVKNRMVRIKKPTEHYPIFIRGCRVDPTKEAPHPKPFFKIYEPLNPEKGFRFMYAPRGGKPKSYINGLAELKELHKKYNSMLDDGEEATKVGEAVICSGERDALCCKAMGFAPIWFNSETYQLSESEYREITKYAEILYNVPDLDDTGRRKGTELALKYIDIRTVWLPESLAQYKDFRGKSRKDLRDWCDLGRTMDDFKKLLGMAEPAKFWTETKKNDNIDYKINSLALLNFFQLNGFRILHDEAAKEPIFIYIQGNVVQRVQSEDLRRFLMKWAKDHFLNNSVRSLIVNSPRLVGTALMGAIEEVDLDFTRHRPHSQIFFFKQNETRNVAVEVTPTGITSLPDGSVESYVWDKRVIPHKYTPLDAPFTITSTKDGGKNRYDIEVLNSASPLFCYLINSSRLYWRKELEDNFENRPDTEQKAYFEANHFRIDGEGLTEEEIYEQKLTLINKIFTIGYMLHGYKSPERAWAPYAMDYKIGENGECNGRSGKSLLFTFISKMMNLCTIDAKNLSDDNKFAFSRVERDTDIIFYDDLKERIAFQQFYSLITAGVTVNGKHTNEFRLEFEESPKIAFSTNYAPTDLNKSTLGRVLFMLFADYYHQNDDSSSEYRENRAVSDDFGRALWTKVYPESDWNADFNFALYCAQFYLSTLESGVKIQPPMSNILRRHHKAGMGENFEDWAEVYFAPDSGNLDRMLVRATVFNDYTSSIGNLGARYSMKRFTQQLKSFCEYAEHIHTLNPSELKNSQGRIVRRVDTKSEEHIYLRSTRAAQLGEAFNTGDPVATTSTDMFIPDESPQPF